MSEDNLKEGSLIFSRLALDPEKAAYLSQLGEDRKKQLLLVVDEAVKRILGHEEIDPESARQMGENHYRLGVPIDWIRESLEWVRDDYFSRTDNLPECLRIGKRFLSHLTFQSEGMVRGRGKVLSLMSRIDALLILEGDPLKSFEQMFDVLSSELSLSGGWIGLPDKEHIFQPLVTSGPWMNRYLEGIEIRSDDSPRGQGPMGVAYRTGKIQVLEDVQSLEILYPWKKQLIDFSIHSTASIPLQDASGNRVVLSVYSDFPWFFRHPDSRILLDHLKVILDQMFARQQATMMIEKERLHLDRVNRLQKAFSRASEILFSAREEEEVIDSILETIVTSGFFDWATLGLIGPDRMISYGSAKGKGVESFLRENVRVPVDGKTLAGQAVRSNTMQYLNEYPRSDVFPALRSLSLKLDVQSVGAVSIERSGKQWGVLVVMSKDPGAFDSDTVDFFQGVSRFLGQSLDAIEMRQKLETEKNRQEWLASHDALTGIHNRRLLKEFLERALEVHRSTGTMVAVGLLDLDDFKKINDLYGHGAGDKLLLEMSRRLVGVLRKEDAVARFGGDEFVLILQGLKDRTALTDLLSRIHREVFEPPVLLSEGEPVTIQASLGICIARQDDKPDSLLKRADEALYRVKGIKKTRLSYYALCDSSEESF